MVDIGAGPAGLPVGLAGRPRRRGARSHPDGVVDLSVGTPVDPVAASSSGRALAAVSDQPGYPTTHGTPELRQAAVGALARRYGVTGLDPDAVLPTIGSKELVAWLPTLLGVRRRGPGGHSRARLSDLRGRRPARRRRGGARWRGSPRSGRAVPRCCGSTRRPTRPAGCCPSSTCARSSTGLGSGAPSSPPTSATWPSPGTLSPVSILHPGQRREHRGPAGRALAVQVLQPGRLPRRLRHRRSRCWSAAAGDPQARRDDRAAGRCSRR